MSFRQMLLAGFLLIALVLGAAAVQGLRMLEAFAVHSRTGAETALGLTTAAQQLAERTVDMERSARQYQVLGEEALKSRFLASRRDAEEALSSFASVAPSTLGGVAETWRAAADQAELALDKAAPAPASASTSPDNASTSPDNAASASDAAASASDLREALDRLHTINERLAIEARYWVARESANMLDTLEANRLRLAWQVMLAVAVAIALAGMFGWALVRPVKKIEDSIEQLGESQLDKAIEIGGPADLRQVGQRLDWLRQRLGELEADRVRMLRHVSHELKTPLAALREGVALLEDEVAGPLAEPQREVVGILRDNAHLLQGRIEDLLGFNAAVFDARRLHRTRIDLPELLARVADGQQLQAQSREVSIDLESGPALVEADEDKLSVAIGNLLANAISFSPPGSAVTLRARRVGRLVNIDCIDRGPGVDEDDARRIFDPFFQGRRQPTTPRQGSGVGLSIVREYVQAHGGRVTLLSTDRGAHFRIELPMAA